MRKYIPHIFLVLGIVIFDQYSKYLVVENFRLYEKLNIIPGFLDFTHTQNKGIAFSLGGNLGDLPRMIAFKILPIGICFFIVNEFRQEYQKKNMAMAYAYLLILGGAIGNIIDRVRLDYVVDFISVYSNGTFGTWRFAVFNVADSAVSVGATILVWNLTLPWIKSKIASFKNRSST